MSKNSFQQNQVPEWTNREKQITFPSLNLRLHSPSDPLPDDFVSQLGLPEECRVHARLPGHQDQGWPGPGGRGALQGGPELLLLLIRTAVRSRKPPASSPTPSAHSTLSSEQATSVMFDSRPHPPDSPSSLPPRRRRRAAGSHEGARGQRIGRRQMRPTGGSSPAGGRAQVQHIGSEASPPPTPPPDGSPKRGPAVTASRPEPAQPVDTQLLKKVKLKNIVHCLLQPQGSQATTNFLCYFGVLYAYIYEYEYIVRMCANVVVFFVLVFFF